MVSRPLVDELVPKSDVVATDDDVTFWLNVVSSTVVEMISVVTNKDELVDIFSANVEVIDAIEEDDCETDEDVDKELEIVVELFVVFDVCIGSVIVKLSAVGMTVEMIEEFVESKVSLKFCGLIGLSLIKIVSKKKF